MKFKHYLQAIWWTNKDRDPMWVQHHTAQALVEYANTHPELGFGSIEVEHHVTYDGLDISP